MPQLPQLWTAAGLATELRRDPRTVLRALRDVPPDGRIGKSAAWYMANASAALAPVERRFRPSNGGDETAINNVEDVWADLRRAFGDLEREQDINARRVMVQDTVASLVKDLEAALDALWHSDEDRLVFGPCRDRVIATAISELARLCEAKLQNTPTGLALVVP